MTKKQDCRTASYLRLRIADEDTGLHVLTKPGNEKENRNAGGECTSKRSLKRAAGRGRKIYCKVVQPRTPRLTARREAPQNISCTFCSTGSTDSWHVTCAKTARASSSAVRRFRKSYSVSGWSTKPLPEDLLSAKHETRGGTLSPTLGGHGFWTTAP